MFCFTLYARRIGTISHFKKHEQHTYLMCENYVQCWASTLRVCALQCIFASMPCRQPATPSPHSITWALSDNLFVIQTHHTHIHKQMQARNICMLSARLCVQGATSMHSQSIISLLMFSHIGWCLCVWLGHFGAISLNSAIRLILYACMQHAFI